MNGGLRVAVLLVCADFGGRHPGGRRDPLVLFVVALFYWVRPRRVFGPAADLLSCVDKKGGKEATPADSALAKRGLPCAARALRVAPNSLRELRSLRSNRRREVSC
jgi:hypothetical protein